MPSKECGTGKGFIKRNIVWNTWIDEGILMKKLNECKNFGELFEAIGEEQFGRVAYILILLMIGAPLVAGIINLFMLQSSYNYITPYDAYNYNYKCMTIWNMVFTLMLFWTGVYVVGSSQYNKWGVKGLFQSIRQKQPWFLWWLMLLIWTVIPIVFSVDPQGALIGTSQLASGYLSHIYMIGVMGCAFMVSDGKQREDIIWAYIGITDILSVIMISFEYDLPIFRWFSAAPGVSVYTNSNHYGYIITMSCLAIFGMLYFCIYDENAEKRTGKIWTCIISFTVQAFAIVINDTLGSYLAIVFALIVMPILWYVRTHKTKAICFMPHVILALITIISYMGMIPTKLGSSIGPSLVVFFQDLFKVSQKSEGYQHAGTDRIGLWIDTIKRIMERPVVGYGPDIITDRNGNYILWNTPHNEFLECAFFMGIPGLIFYLGGLIHLFIMKIKRIKELKIYELITGGVIIAYLAGSFFGVRKFNTVCYFFLFIGLLVGREAKLKKN